MTDGIRHFYANIPGWFDDDFKRVYQQAVDRARGGEIFVEVGSWLGRSTAFLIVELMNQGKMISFYAVDHWCGSPGKQYLTEIAHHGDAFARFMAMLVDNRVVDQVWPLRCDSTMAAGAFRDDSLDFVFLDAAHDFESVRKDVQAWLPKVKEGGVLAGHDVPCPGLMNAVHEFIDPRAIEIQGTCWVYTRRLPTAMEHREYVEQVSRLGVTHREARIVGRFDTSLGSLAPNDYLYRAHLYAKTPHFVHTVVCSDVPIEQYMKKWGGPPNDEVFTIPYNTTTHDW